MLTDQTTPLEINPEYIEDAKVAIVASKYNAKHVQSMLDAAVTILKENAIEPLIYRVPGAFEIPCVVAALASSEYLDAIITLGVVIEGETEHARLVSESVTRELARIQTDNEIPIAHGVLLVRNQEQADKRCLDPEHNRGKEVANTALEMISVMSPLQEQIDEQLYQDYQEISDYLNEEIDDEA